VSPCYAAVREIAASAMLLQERPLQISGDFAVGSARYRPVSVHRLGKMPIQSCGPSVSAPRGKAGARLTVHTELRTMRQCSAREAIYRNRPIARHVI
jgi:hypothetical protein